MSLDIYDYFDAIEADFQRYYGMDLRECLWGENPMGARRFTALLKWLPPESALNRARDPRGWNWDQQTEFLAALIEVVDHGNRLFYSANSEKGAKKMKPVKIKRPWEMNKKPLPTSLALASIGAPVRYTGGGEE